MHARLTLHFHDAPARQLYLEQGREYLLGRSANSDIPIENSNISRRHARLSYSDECWHIEDLGSKNGIAIDGAAVDSAPVTGNTWISLGEFLIHFELRSQQQYDADQSRQHRRHETSLQLSRALRPAAGVEPLLKKVLTSVVQMAGMERGFAMLARSDGDMEVVCTIGAAADDASAFRGSVGAVNHALTTRASVVSMDVQQFAPLADRPSIIAGNIRSLVCLPMHIVERTIGAVYADNRTTAKVLTELDMEILEGMIGHATTALAVAQLDKEIIDINSILRRGEVNIEQLARWQKSLPGYRQPLENSDQRADPQDSARLTWSRVATTKR